jgi:hypothetical protein
LERRISKLVLIWYKIHFLKNEKYKLLFYLDEKTTKICNIPIRDILSLEIEELGISLCVTLAPLVL